MMGSLVDFSFFDLAPYTKERSIANAGDKQFQLFYVGRDDVHSILKQLLSAASTSIYLNMFGYDDPELNQILMKKLLDPHITCLVTLDKSQAGGVHEKALLDLDRKHNLKSVGSHFVVGQSATHQISHTKGGVLDGRIGFEGSVNWSASGEGTFVTKGAPGGKGYKAQNNTLAVFTDQDNVNRFQSELIAEHVIATAQQV